MELSPYLQSIADDLDKVTALADDDTREVTRRLLTALEPGLRLALVQAISDATAIIGAELDDVVALVRMEDATRSSPSTGSGRRTRLAPRRRTRATTAPG